MSPPCDQVATKPGHLPANRHPPPPSPPAPPCAALAPSPSVPISPVPSAATAAEPPQDGGRCPRRLPHGARREGAAAARRGSWAGNGCKKGGGGGEQSKATQSKAKPRSRPRLQPPARAVRTCPPRAPRAVFPSLSDRGGARRRRRAHWWRARRGAAHWLRGTGQWGALYPGGWGDGELFPAGSVTSAGAAVGGGGGDR